ncbi:MAG: patatin-like phospholipase family protein [Planctomycetes bacterium]|nr:patatin-like phospholipase family protein [Planctomycetota bacterium]
MGASHSVRAASWLPWALALGLGLAGIALTGCGLPKRPDLLMPGFETLEPLVGFESVRAVAGYPSVEFQREFDVSMATFARRPVPLDGKRDFDILVLSSGGVNGSFGAGALTAWTELGERPDFELVTGVSIGAILAPFAFAGPDFDDRLVELFRYVERDDVMEEKTLLTAMIWDESVMSSEPLCERIELGVDEALMEAMAARHRAGARCYVGTTNLDRGQFVVWDLGAIAVHESEQVEIERFIQIIHRPQPHRLHH